MVKFKIKLTTEGCEPTKAHPSDAGWDLRAAREYLIPPGGRVAINCGVQLELPEGYEAQIRPRSGLAIKKGLTVLNTPGTIDEHYRGIIGAIIINHSGVNHIVEKGDRIAQMVVKEVEPSEYEIVDELNETDRGESGYGSSGK